MINVKNIYWMLAYAFRNINIGELKQMTSEEFDNIYDLFCVMLTQGISKQIKRGLNKDYIIHSEKISGVKGRILLTESVKNNSFVENKLICEYDEYSENCYLNRIIKTAGMYIIKSNKVSDQSKINNLKKVLQYLKDVDVLEIRAINWKAIEYNRNNASYKFLVNVSKFILEGLLINESSGKIEFLDFIDDQQLYHLYEKFILEYFIYHYKNELHPCDPQISWNLENDVFIEELPKMQTDIVLQNDGKKLIIDAKFYTTILQKQYDKKTYRNNNINQIYTYVRNEDKENIGNVSGMLLYAKIDDESIGWKEMKIGSNTFIITELDLSREFCYIEEQMRRIAEWVKQR